MSTAMRLQWNIRVLQRHDPAITTIVDQFTYAVLYRYEEDRWVKRGVEGSMFVYTRTDPPIHGFCILNREGAGNFVQPLRRGDEMEVTDDYIIYRPVDVGLDEFERFIGIWTADLVERKRLSDFMMKIHNHIAKTDIPYSPVLLYHPLEKPEDASLPLIQPLPPPPGQSPKKNRRGHQKNAPSSSYPEEQPSPVPGQAVPASSSSTNESTALSGGHASINSLFAKLTTPQAMTPPPPSNPSPAPGLGGPALLQAMFASAAASAAAVSTTSTTSTTTVSQGGAAVTSTEHKSTNASAVVPGDEGNMLKQLLGIPVQSSSAPSLAPPVDSSLPTPRTPSVPAGFIPINEDEEGSPVAPPRTPPNMYSHAGNPNVQTTPTSKSKRQVQHNGGGRELIAYNFENDGAAGIVSPWMNEPLQRPRNEKTIPPSPSQLPQPRAVREKRNKTNRRNGSPALHQQHPAQQQQQQQPRPTYVPRNNSFDESARQLDRDAASEALLQALRAPGSSIIQGYDSSSLSKELFIQELLGLIHSGDGFADSVYRKYLALHALANGPSTQPTPSGVVFLD